MTHAPPRKRPASSKDLYNIENRSPLPPPPTATRTANTQHRQTTTYERRSRRPSAPSARLRSPPPHSPALVRAPSEQVRHPAGEPRLVAPIQPQLLARGRRGHRPTLVVLLARVPLQRRRKTEHGEGGRGWRCPARQILRRGLRRSRASFSAKTAAAAAAAAVAAAAVAAAEVATSGAAATTTVPSKKATTKAER